MVCFPKIAVDSTLLQIRFSGTVLRHGTTFSGKAVNSETGGLPQPAMPGNVVMLGEADADDLSDLTIQMSIEQKFITDVSVSPHPFSPNGDGIHDAAEISYSILTLTRTRPVRVIVYDLSGRPVRNLHTGNEGSGAYAWPWDGNDDEGKCVPPGSRVSLARTHG